MPQPRSASISSAEPVGDEVGVGGDVDSEDLDVVGGVDEDREVLAEDVLHPGGELGAAGAAGEDYDAHLTRRCPRAGR